MKRVHREKKDRHTMTVRFAKHAEPELETELWRLNHDETCQGVQRGVQQE